MFTSSSTLTPEEYKSSMMAWSRYLSSSLLSLLSRNRFSICSIYKAWGYLIDFFGEDTNRNGLKET